MADRIAGMGTDALVANQRRHERKPSVTNVTILVEATRETQKAVRELTVTTHGISRGDLASSIGNTFTRPL